MANQMEIRHTIGANGMVALRSLSGSIKLSGADTDEAVVVARATHGDLPQLNIEKSAGRLLVEPERVGLQIMRRNEAAVEFEVTLPRGARVDLKSLSGDVVSSGLNGEQEYKTVSGDLHLSGVAGRLTLQSVSGDVHLYGGKRLELSATTTSGDLYVDAELIDYLHTRTVSGDIRLTGRLADGPRHSVETVSGDLDFRTTGGVVVEPSRALDIGRSGRRPVVIGNGAAQLSFRSMSGEHRVTAAGATTDHQAPAAEPMAHDADAPTSTYRTTTAPAATRLDVLRALERGEIDVDEAARRLQEVSVDA